MSRRPPTAARNVSRRFPTEELATEILVRNNLLFGK